MSERSCAQSSGRSERTPRRSAPVTPRRVEDTFPSAIERTWSENVGPFSTERGGVSRRVTTTPGHALRLGGVRQPFERDCRRDAAGRWHGRQGDPIETRSRLPSGSPDGILVPPLQREPLQRARSAKLIDPDRGLLSIVAADGEASAVARGSDMCEWAGRTGSCVSSPARVARAIAGLSRLRRDGTWKVHEIPRVRDRELRCASRSGNGSPDAFDDRNRLARHFLARRIERHGKHDAADRVQDMTRGDVAGVAAAFDQRLARAGRPATARRSAPDPSGRDPTAAAPDTQRPTVKRSASPPGSICGPWASSPSSTIASCSRAPPAAGQRAMPARPRPKMMSLPCHAMPNTSSALQTVTAAPPSDGDAFDGPIGAEKKASDWPSGEKTGCERRGRRS